VRRLVSLGLIFAAAAAVGLGAASAYVLALILGLAAVVYVRFVSRRTEY